MIKVVQIGMGPLGIKIGEFIADRNGIETVGAIDKNPELVGKSLYELNESLSNKVIISTSLSEIIRNTNPDVAVLTTVSDMERITPQILEILAHNIPIVSTCEELSYPWENAAENASMIDEKAKSAGVAVVGTGVNPGFLMDSLPVFLTSICQRVDQVIVRRYQDASHRRTPFQKKIGAGLSLDEFEERKINLTLRHVGLSESIYHFANAMGWKLDHVSDEITPVIANETITSGAFEIQSGMAAGVLQIGLGKIGNEEKVRLEFRAAVGEPDSFDEIEIQGNPSFTSRIENGINGDVATCAIVVNAVKTILNANPGLRVMADMPLTSYYD